MTFARAIRGTEAVCGRDARTIRLHPSGFAVTGRPSLLVTAERAARSRMVQASRLHEALR
jgi:hypothetical protein